MRNNKKITVKKSRVKKHKNKKTRAKKPSFEPDVIEKDLCNLFTKEWLKQAAKDTGMIKRERKILNSQKIRHYN